MLYYAFASGYPPEICSANHSDLLDQQSWTSEHQPDECIDLERLVQNAQIIANAIVKLANLPLE